MAKRIYKAKEPVRLRFQQLKDGNKSIYLDYSANGKRVREFLRLYLIPEHNHQERDKNIETLRLANAVKAQRITEAQNDSFGFRTTGRGKILLSDYLKLEAERYQNRDSESFSKGVLFTRKKIIAFGDRPLNKIDKAYLMDFINYLKTTPDKYGKTLAKNSQVRFLSVLTIALNTAVKNGLIKENPIHKIDSNDKPKSEQSKRVFLTMEDLSKLYHTPAKKRRGYTISDYEEVQRAFFFACYTGLRFSDMISLRWEEIKTLPNGEKLIEKTQQKTKETAYIDVSKEALKYLPNIDNNAPKNGLIFNLRNDDYVWQILKDWSKRADLQKNISFHTARHTFATLGIASGVDIYTMRDLLGHKNIATTQIYAKVVAENKRKAVNLIPSIQ